MGFASILIVSILMIASFLVHSLVTAQASYYVNGVSFYAIIILNVILCFLVFVDAKKHRLSTSHAAATLFLGGFGGILYLFARGKNPDEISKQSPMSETSKKNSRIFSYLLALLFGIPLMYMILNGYSLTEPMILVFGAIVLLSILMAFFARSKN